MSKKPYKKLEESKDSVANDATTAYNSLKNTDSNIGLPDDILIGALHYAQEAQGQGRVIPNNEIHKRMSERLGWK